MMQQVLQSCDSDEEILVVHVHIKCETTTKFADLQVRHVVTSRICPRKSTMQNKGILAYYFRTQERPTNEGYRAVRII